MSLTKTQRRLHKEAEKIAEMVMVDFWNVEKRDAKERTTLLEIAIRGMVVGRVITEYTLFDEVLSDLICRYFFKKYGKRNFLLWQQKKFRLFVNFMLDEMYLIKKLEFAHAIKPIPKEVRNTIYKVNSIRNAMAHSFYPENRKEHRKLGKILYSGRDIRTSDGLHTFIEDCRRDWVYLAKRAFGGWQ